MKRPKRAAKAFHHDPGPDSHSSARGAAFAFFVQVCPGRHNPTQKIGNRFPGIF